MLNHKVKSYGIMHPLLKSWDTCDESDCEDDEKDFGKDSIFCPKPCKDSSLCSGDQEIVFKLVIYNTCGNNNEIIVCPPHITTSMGNVDDVRDGFIMNLTDAIKDLISNYAGHMTKLTVPIYVINISNVLTSGNKNEICIE